MSAIQTPTIQNIISRDIKDPSGLKDSTQEYKEDILKDLWISRSNSWIFSDVKNYLINIFNA